MAKKDSPEKESAPNPARERLDLRAELDHLDSMLSELRVLFEQYFSGLIPLAPEKPHAEVKRKIRQLRKAPFKNSALNYRLRTLEVRYGTLHTYWQRVLREREEGTYHKDIFKANMRERQASEAAFAQTQEGAADKGMKNLFDAYRSALEKVSGHAPRIDFGAFKDSLIKRAKDYKRQHGDKKLTFKVVVKDGKVAVRASVKESPAK